jgi:hypothetical protein
MEATHELSAVQLDQLYRLVWLVMGDERRAARSMLHAARSTQHGGDFTSILVKLAPQRTLRYTLRVPPTANERSGLTPSECAALARTMRAATPQARLELGAPHLVEEALTPSLAQHRPPAHGRGEGDAGETTLWPRQATTGIELFLLLARSWGDVPAEAPYALAQQHAQALLGEVSDVEAQALRATLLVSGPEGELARSVRSGLRRADDRLGAALPALFAGQAPAELHALREQGRTVSVQRSASSRAKRLQLLLAGAVLALVIAVIVAPGRSAPTASVSPEHTGLLAAEATLTPSERILAALNRFERGELGVGVLHERYRMIIEGETQTLERWYDPGEPGRVRIEARNSADQLLFGMATDGATRLQARWLPPGVTTQQLLGVDYLLDETTLARVFPIVRRQPDGLHFFATLPLVNPEHFYLAQAHAAELQDLGAAIVQNRPVRLVGFASRQSLPPSAVNSYAPPRQETADQVILAIDTVTYALLEVRVLPQSETAGAVVVPWQVEIYETQANVPSTIFKLDPVEGRRQMGVNTFISPRISWLPNDALTTLASALASSTLPLALSPPDQVSLGYALQANSEAILVRESEHETFMLAVFPAEAIPTLSGRQEERRVGDLRYRMIYPDEPHSSAAVSLAAVALANGAELQMYYQHAYATPEEREARVAELLSALEPLTLESLDVLATDFVR